jgi:hypothetical protein
MYYFGTSITRDILLVGAADGFEANIEFKLSEKYSYNHFKPSIWDALSKFCAVFIMLYSFNLIFKMLNRFLFDNELDDVIFRVDTKVHQHAKMKPYNG